MERCWACRRRCFWRRRRRRIPGSRPDRARGDGRAHPRCPNLARRRHRSRDRRQFRRRHPALPDGRISGDLRRRPSAAPSAGRKLEAQRRRIGLDLQAAPGRQFPQRQDDDGGRRGRDDRSPRRSEECLQRALGLQRRAVQGRHEEGGRLDRRIPSRRAERQLSLLCLLGQLQHHHPAGGLCRGLREELHRHRALQAGEIHPEGRVPPSSAIRTTGARRRCRNGRSSASTPTSSPRSWPCRAGWSMSSPRSPCCRAWRC